MTESQLFDHFDPPPLRQFCSCKNNLKMLDNPLYQTVYFTSSLGASRFFLPTTLVLSYSGVPILSFPRMIGIT